MFEFASFPALHDANFCSDTTQLRATIRYECYHAVVLPADVVRSLRGRDDRMAAVTTLRRQPYLARRRKQGG